MRDFVSVEPTRLKSIITFSSNKSLLSSSLVVKIRPLIPFVKDFKRVIREPLYAPLFSASYSELSIIVRIFRVTSAKVGYNSEPYLFVDSVRFQPQSSYDFSTASLRTAGIAAYIGQHTLKISIKRSRCSKI